MSSDGQVRRWWTERWGSDGNTADLGEGELLMPADVARILSAAPDMARALCLVEWSYNQEWSLSECACCGRPKTDFDAARGGDEGGLFGHAPDCALDAALTKAGLTIEDREAARRGNM